MRLRRTEITVEVQQRMTLKRPKSRLQRNCTECPTESSMLSPEDAAYLCGFSTRAIYRWLETGAIHFVENSYGAVYVCLDSLLQAHNTTQVTVAPDVNGHTTA